MSTSVSLSAHNSELIEITNIQPKNNAVLSQECRKNKATNTLIASEMTAHSTIK